jgi:Phosphoesterase family
LPGEARRSAGHRRREVAIASDIGLPTRELPANSYKPHPGKAAKPFDEGSGYYDSGYIQPLDFFGDGPRIPFIVVSDFSRGGCIVHSYYDHVSILKFIECNWMLKPVTARSRDNLPNPVAQHDNPYVPHNRPAIGDLFEMFDFGRRSAGRACVPSLRDKDWTGIRNLNNPTGAASKFKERTISWTKVIVGLIEARLHPVTF